MLMWWRLEARPLIGCLGLTPGDWLVRLDGLAVVSTLIVLRLFGCLV